MKRAYVIGSPISHSLSPAIFGYLVSQTQVELNYRAQEVKEDELFSFLQEFRNEDDSLGLNVTIPLKEKILTYLNEITPEVKALKAANVVHARAKNLKGYNTDVIGVQKTIESHFENLSGKSVMVVGAGGSARAVLFALCSFRPESIALFNRDEKRAEELIRDFSPLFPEVRFEHWRESHAGGPYSMIINCTPVGMKGKQGTPEEHAAFFGPFLKSLFSENALAFDLIYTPEETPFLNLAKARGLRTVAGLPMLVDQAIGTFDIWFQKKVGPELRENLFHLLRGILVLRQDPRPLFLTGFMGVGKTTVAKELSQLTQRDCIDTDRKIEDSSGLRVPEIFEKMGEKEFRKMETDAVAKVSAGTQTLVSLGGGALTQKENLDQIKSSGRLVYLSASIPALAERLKHAKKVRPILAGLSDEDRILKMEALLKDRLPQYRQADIEVDTDGATSRQVAERILIELGRRQYS